MKDSNFLYGILCYFRKFGVYWLKKNYLYMLCMLCCDLNKVYVIYIFCFLWVLVVVLVGISGL